MIVRATGYAVTGALLLLAGVALIFIPPYTGMGLGFLLVIVSSVSFALAYSSSMRAVRGEHG